MIYSFGDITLDLIWDFPSAYRQESFPETGELRYQVGGVAHNLAKAALEAGEPARIIGKVGNDIFGQYILEAAKEHDWGDHILRDENSTTCLMSIFSFFSDGDRKNRFMTYNCGNASHALTVSDIRQMDIQFTPRDILFVTGYSLFTPSIGEVAAYTIEKARRKGARIVVDLLPHDLSRMENQQIVFQRFFNIFRDTRADLCIGEFRTWNYLLNRCRNETPGLGDMEKMAQQAADVADHTCIRHGFENCEIETLYSGDALMYEADTGYRNLSQADKLGFGEKLTILLIQQLFLHRHAWLYRKGETFTTPLACLGLLPPDMPVGAKILDIGCGYGRVMETLISSGFNTVQGLDTSLSMVEKARSRCPGSLVHHCSVNALGKQHERFDVCILMGVLTTLQHDRDIRGLVSDISGIMDKGGYLVVSDFLINDTPEYQKKYKVFQDLFPNSSHGTFLSRNGAINRHFDREFIRAVLDEFFEVMRFEAENIPTVNNNLSNGFSLLCRKR